MTPTPSRSLAVAVCLMLAAGCGKKGPPLPPLRPVPAPVAGFAIERTARLVTITLTVPSANQDGTTPPAVDRIEIYGVTQLADAPEPTPAALMTQANLVATMPVRPADAEPAGTPDPRPAPGEAATFADAVAIAGAGGPPVVRFYAAVAVAGRRAGRSSPILAVPLSEAPPVPAGLEIAYTARTLALRWQSAPGLAYAVERTDQAGAGAERLASALEGAAFEAPVEFGRTVCFVVRSLAVTGPVTVVGPPSPPACVTPIDTFPPPPPTGLLAVAGDGAIELTWNPVTAPDLAGYVVLRGDGANGALTPLTPSPVAGSTYRDQTARAGQTYVYAVAAVDAATPRNTSELSNRYVVTARQAVASRRAARER